MIKLKIYSISILLLLSACSSSRRTPPVFDPTTTLQRQQVALADIPVPPWAVWYSSKEPVTEVLKDADQLARRGAIEEAFVRYGDLRSRSSSAALRNELMTRQLGALLQLGEGQRVLKESASYLNEEGYSLETSPSGIALLVGYAYVQQRNPDQAIAWFAKSAASRDPGKYSAQAKRALTSAVQSIPPALFETHAQRWQAEPVVGKLFVNERIRRSRGAAPEPELAAKYFSAETYRMELPSIVRLRGEAAPAATQAQTQTPGQLEGTDSMALLPAEGIRAQRKIGVLLPLSGQYAEHALKVKHGILLAAAQSLPPIEVDVRDTKGDPQIAGQAYAELAESGVAVVLGPLLVKTTEEVAIRTQQYNVPIVSFTKRTGVPQLGPLVFRLGVTMENQIEEVLRYALEQLQVSRFAILFPAHVSGEEYAYNFTAALSSLGGMLVGSESYYPNDKDSIKQAVVRVSLSRPQAIFVPDQLDFVLPLLGDLEKSDSTDAVLLGPALWDDPVAIRGFGQLLDGAVYVTPFYRASIRPEVTQFMDSYRREFQHTPELLAAQSFDATKLVVSAIDKAQSSDVSVYTVLREQTMPTTGVTGRLQVRESGEIYREMSILRLFKGEIVEVMSQGVATGFVPGESGAGVTISSDGVAIISQPEDAVEGADSSGQEAKEAAQSGITEKVSSASKKRVSVEEMQPLSAEERKAIESGTIVNKKSPATNSSFPPAATSKQPS